MQTSTISRRPSGPASRSSRRTVATIALLGLVGTLGSVGFGATAASADDSVAIAIVAPPAPVVASQNDAPAVAEKAIPANELKLVVIRSKGAAEIAKRLISLSESQGKLAKETTDCGFNAARGAEMMTTAAGLTALGAQLAATTDLTVANTLFRQIFTEYRVYLVVLPKTGKAIRCDNALASVAAFNVSAAKVQVAIDAAKAKGADTTNAQALKDASVATVAGLNPAAAITPCMGLVPDKGDKTVQAANAAALAACDASLDTVNASLKSARAQLSQARDSLKGARSADRDADKAKREQEREDEKDVREAKKDADKAARETKKAADKLARELAKAAKKS